MPKQITLEEALKLVSFKHSVLWGWQIRDVNSSVTGDVNADVWGDVDGHVYCNVTGAIGGNVGKYVGGKVFGTIKGRQWQFVESPEKKLQRLIAESGNQELIDTFNQMEDN